MKLSVPIGILLLTSLGSCFASPRFSGTESQVDVCVLPDEAGIGVLYVQRGIHAGSHETAVAALREIVAGRRLFPPAGGFLSFDLDEEQEELKGKALLDITVADLSKLEFLRSARVMKAGLFADERGELGIYQLWRFAKPAYLFDRFNQMSNGKVLERADSGMPFEPEFPLLDQPSWDRAVAKARAGWRWSRLDQDGIIIELPITPECAAKCFQALVSDEGLRDHLAASLASVQSVEITDDLMRVRFAGESGGWFRLILCKEPGEYDIGLHEAVRAAGIPVERVPRPKELAQILSK